MSHEAPTPIPESQKDDFDAWERELTTPTVEEQKQEIFDNEELSDWEKLHAVKDLGAEAVEQTVENPSSLDVHDNSSPTPEDVNELAAEGSDSPESPEKEKDPFEVGQPVTVSRNAYTNGRLDRSKPGRLEDGWKIEAVNPDGSYTVTIDNGAMHDGRTGMLYKTVSREMLNGWKEANQAMEQGMAENNSVADAEATPLTEPVDERAAKAEAAIRQFNEQLNNNPANLDSTNLPIYSESNTRDASHRSLRDRLRGRDTKEKVVKSKQERNQEFRDKMKARHEKQIAQVEKAEKRRADRRQKWAERARKTKESIRANATELRTSARNKRDAVGKFGNRIVTATRAARQAGSASWESTKA